LEGKLTDKKFLQLSDIEAYQTAYSLSNYTWDIVTKWDYFAKDTVGKQFVRAVDSISANIAEGFGRYGKKDKICFYRYSYGSTKESLDWNQKAKFRGLISQKEYQFISEKLTELPRSINYLIKFTNDKLSN